MFQKISVLIPTRRRLDRLNTLLASYERTTHCALGSSELVFRVDDDDPETAQFLTARGYRTLVGPRLQGYRSLPIFFNEMTRVATGDVFMCGNDDMVFQTPGWAPLILKAADEYPDGLFNFGVSTHNESHYPFSIISRKAVDALGFLWDPRIFWGDIYLRDVMAAFGRTFMLPNVQIDHDWIGHTPDAVFLEEDKDIGRTDPTYWQGTHAQAVTEAVSRLRSA